jgi:hypothetical protein
MEQTLKGLRRLLLWFGIIIAAGAVQWVVGRVLDDRAKNGIPLGWLKVLTAPAAPLWVMAASAVCGLLYVFWPTISQAWKKRAITAPGEATVSPVQSASPPAYPGPQQINPLDSYFSRKIIRLADLIFSPDYRISGKTFDDCFIYGPALVHAFAPITLAHGGIEGDLESSFVDVQGNRRVVGIIGLGDCVFRRCTFIGIGFIGTREANEAMRRQLSS